MVTTVEDYAKFCIAVMNGFGMQKKVYQDMITLHVETKKNVFMGFGWLVVPLDNNEYVICMMVHMKE